ncbi:MAG TPA: mechanosensitive ion channel family protein [Candidatus Scatovivens faecipullorum]|nr:mechanosensitive ion channel family protein [Candidatus Scatovivens faecipullorum]
MAEIKEWLTSINLEDLLKLFDLQIALAVFILFFMFRNLFSKLIIKIYYKIIKSKKNPKDSTMYKPLKKFFILFGLFCTTHILPLDKQFLYLINKAFEVIIAYYITKAVTTLITEDSIIMKNIFKDTSDKAVNKFICKMIRVFIWIIFVFVVTIILELKLDGLGALVTGLGIVSAATALAAQDLVKSMLSGAAILTDKPFVIGDWIEVEQFQGTVIDITFRSTRIKAYNNAVVTIPNSLITSSYVVNWDRLTSRRFDCILTLSWDTTSEKVKKIVKEMKLILQNDPEVIKETVEVSLNNITAYGSEIKIYLYIREADYSKYLKAKQDILCSLLYLIEKENVDLAYPSQTLYVKGKEEIKG